MSILNRIIEQEMKRLNEKKNRAILENKVNSMIQEEIESMVEEVQEQASDIRSKLETIRKNLIKDGVISEMETGSGRNNVAARPEKRIPLEIVSEIADIPINELILYFLNGHRITEGYELIEYRLGMVYFYGNSKSTIVESKHPGTDRIEKNRKSAYDNAKKPVVKDPNEKVTTTPVFTKTSKKVGPDGKSIPNKKNEAASTKSRIAADRRAAEKRSKDRPAPTDTNPVPVKNTKKVGKDGKSISEKKNIINPPEEGPVNPLKKDKNDPYLSPNINKIDKMKPIKDPYNESTPHERKKMDRDLRNNPDSNSPAETPAAPLGRTISSNRPEKLPSRDSTPLDRSKIEVPKFGDGKPSWLAKAKKGQLPPRKTNETSLDSIEQKFGGADNIKAAITKKIQQIESSPAWESAKSKSFDENTMSPEEKKLVVEFIKFGAVFNKFNKESGTQESWLTTPDPNKNTQGPQFGANIGDKPKKKAPDYPPEWDDPSYEEPKDKHPYGPDQ